MEAAECGATCLAMVLAHFGRWEPLDRVRAVCGTARDGVSAAGLLAAAGIFGLEGEGYSGDIDALADNPLPQILFWEFNHFVVLVRVGPGGCVIHDPAVGRRHVGHAELSRCFTGVSLCFRPGPGFPTVRPPGLLGSLCRTFRGSADAVACVLAATMLLAAFGVLLPGMTRVFVDEYLGQGRRDWLVPLLAGIVAMAVIKGLLAWAHSRVQLFVQTRIGALISSDVLWALLRLPLLFLSNRSAAEVATRMQLAGQIAGTATGPFLSLGTNSLTALAYGAAMMAYSVPVAGAVLAIAAVNLVVLRWAERRLRDAASDAQMMAGRAHGVTIRGIAMLEESRAAGLAPWLFCRLMDAYVNESNATNRLAAINNRVGTVPFLADHLITLAVLTLGSWEVMAGSMTLGSLLALQMLAAAFAGPLSGLVSLSSSVLSVSGGLARTQDLLGGPVPAANGPADAAFDGHRLSGGIELDRVSYAYPGRPGLFQNVTVQIGPGTNVAVVGPPGCGKSALAAILTGTLPPLSGTVRFDGAAVADIPAECLRHSVGLVECHPFFAAGTLRDALTFWDPNVPDEAIWAALRMAGMAEVLRARTGGLDGRIGEAGLGFSGGELQRLGLARALVLSPVMVVLDDATTALDPDTETAVLRNLRAAGMTTVLLTSRTTLPAPFDLVLRIEDGVLLRSPTPVAAPVPVAA